MTRFLPPSLTLTRVYGAALLEVGCCDGELASGARGRLLDSDPPAHQLLDVHVAGPDVDSLRNQLPGFQCPPCAPSLTLRCWQAGHPATQDCSAWRTAAACTVCSEIGFSSLDSPDLDVPAVSADLDAGFIYRRKLHSAALQGHTGLNPASGAVTFGFPQFAHQGNKSVFCGHCWRWASPHLCCPPRHHSSALVPPPLLQTGCLWQALTTWSEPANKISRLSRLC